MKAYGFKISDAVGGEYLRWFSTDGKLTFPMTDDLRKVSRVLNDVELFRRAYNVGKELSEEYGFVFEELTEKHFRQQ